MSLSDHKITGVKVMNINEETAEAIEKMVGRSIEEIEAKGLKILDIQTSSDYLILILGKNGS